MKQNWLPVALVVGTVLCATTSCGGDDPGTGSSEAARVWAPAILGFGTFWELEVQPNLTIPARFEEQDLAFDDIEPHLRAEIAAERFDADLVLVPEAMGRRLLADGVLEDPHVVIFSADDPDEAAEMFGLILAPPAGRGTGTGGLRVAEVARYEHGCLAAVERLPAPVAPPAPVAGSRLALDVAEAELIEGTVREAAEGGIEGTLMSLAIDTVFEVFKQLAMALGKETAARVIGAAGPATSTALTAKSILELGDASADVTEARSDAEIAATETYYDAVQAISGARTDLYEIRAGLRSCELSGPDAIERIDGLGTSVTTYERAARDAMADIVRTGGEESALRSEALDNGLSRFLELWADIRAEAAAKDASTLPEDLVSVGETLEEIVGESDTNDWETFVELLTGLDPDNPFTHSNGALMTNAAGTTDLIAVGSAPIEVSDPALRRLLDRFPCGTGPVGFTLCGTGDLTTGLAILTVAVFAATLPIIDALEHFQYGFVFDADGNASNNYTAPPAYPKDLFDGTDRWFEVLHMPTSAWSLKASLARDGSVAAETTAARAILNGNSIAMLIPASELEAALPEYRVTGFRHMGDYGINPPHVFNGDVHPEVGAPLATPATETFVAREDM